MNLVKAIILVAAVVWLQLALLPVLGPWGVVPNLALVVVILVATRMPVTTSLILAVAIGWLLDVGSGSDFGLRTAFYPLLALITASLRQFGSDLENLSLLASVVVAATILFNLMILTNLALIRTSLPLGYIAVHVAIEVALNLLLLVPLRSLSRRWLSGSSTEPLVALRGRRG